MVWRCVACPSRTTSMAFMVARQGQVEDKLPRSYLDFLRSVPSMLRIYCFYPSDALLWYPQCPHPLGLRPCGLSPPHFCPVREPRSASCHARCALKVPPRKASKLEEKLQRMSLPSSLFCLLSSSSSSVVEVVRGVAGLFAVVVAVLWWRYGVYGGSSL